MAGNSKPPRNTPQKYGHARRVIPIRRRIRRRLFLRWLVVLAVGGVILLLTLSTAGFYRTQQERNFGYGLAALVYMAVVYFSRVLPLTTAREWSGVVTDRKVEKYTKMPKGIATRSNLGVMSTRCIWTVERDDGYVEKLPVDTDEIWEHYFCVGERVRLYKNARIPVKAHPPRDEENLMCPLCGVMVMEPVCRHCGVDFTESETPASARDRGGDYPEDR